MKTNKISELNGQKVQNSELRPQNSDKNSELDEISELRPQNSEGEKLPRGRAFGNGKAEESLRAKRSKFSEQSGLSSGAKSEAVSALSSFPKLQRKVTSKIFHRHIYARGMQNA